MNEQQTQAMKLALEALKRMKGYGNNFLYRQTEQNPFEQICEAINALTAALADNALDKKAENARELGLDYEPEQHYLEPGVPCVDCDLIKTVREWVGLTDNEIALIHADYPHPQGYARAIEAKLREKNQ